MTSLAMLHQKLGLDSSNGLNIIRDSGKSPIKKLEKLFDDPRLKPHSVFAVAEKPLILFYDNPVHEEAVFKAVWNLNEVPIVIVLKAGAIDIYNGFEYLKHKSSLAPLGNAEQTLSYFSYYKLLTGETWQKFEKNFSYKNRVDYKLLEYIKAARAVLQQNYSLDNHTANALLGKSIFTRYLIDRKVRIAFDSDKPREWTNSDYYEVLQTKKKAFEFFRYLEDTFGEDLFPFDDGKAAINRDALQTVVALFHGTNLSTNQISLFDIFDFSIIPVEFISNVYELFIGQTEQAASSAYYTPLFLVEYITAQTVGNYFKNPEAGISCKVLDPACGSGIFLVESLRVIIEQFNRLNPTLSRGTDEYRKRLAKLTEDNIYGIDKDKSAVSIAIFSIYLTLLDYQSPRDIEKFKFPKLLDKNLIVSDFFDVKKQFNKEFKSVRFNFIIGNPPWKRGAANIQGTPLFKAYIDERSKREPGTVISNKEIAQAFLLRVSDFSDANTRSALIVTSKTLYNLKASGFRKNFLKRFALEKVFELCSVRREVFNKSNDPAIAPAAILFYRSGSDQDIRNNHFIHLSIKPSHFFSLFNLFVIQRNDVKTVQQRLLLEHDWLWKTLLYGHYLDFNFLLKLSKYNTIDQRIETKGYMKGQGFQIGQDKNPLGELKKLEVLSHHVVVPFKVFPHLVPLTEKTLHRPRNPDLYYGTRLLIKKGLRPDLKSVAGICYIDCLFKDTLTAVRAFEKADIKDLRIISGLLQSRLFSYYALHKFSSTGVEREQSFNEEKFSFPFTDDKKISEAVHEIEKSITDAEFLTHENGPERQLLKVLDDAVYDAFGITSVERAFVDYTLEYSIPSQVTMAKQRSNTKLALKSPVVSRYVKVFTENFGQRFGGNKSLTAEVWHSRYIIGIFFKLTEWNDNRTEPVTWLNKENDAMVKLLISLGHQKITDKLFIQQDVRGFEKNQFYIFKPNEKKMWHQAMAYLDLNDFIDAILKAGRKA